MYLYSLRNQPHSSAYLALLPYLPVLRLRLCRFGRGSVPSLWSYPPNRGGHYPIYCIAHHAIPVLGIQDVCVIGDQTYIVMDYINAPELTYLSTQHRKCIFDQMRALKPPNAGGTSRWTIRFGGGLSYLGHHFVLASDDHRKAWPQFQEVANRAYQTKFTHADIAPDWETAGWYPEYWEYIRLQIPETVAGCA
jgi:hypothetical protein